MAFASLLACFLCDGCSSSRARSQLEVLNAMRVPGGKTISEESWQAILNTEVRTSSDEEPQSDPRLRAARG